MQFRFYSRCTNGPRFRYTNSMAYFRDESGDESNEEEWEEEKEAEEMNVLCLFCNILFRNAEETYAHCKSFHRFDIACQKTKQSLDCYSYIKMVNFMRIHKLTPDELKNSKPSSWELDQYMKPSITDDRLLMFDIEDCDIQRKTDNLNNDIEDHEIEDNMSSGDGELVHIPRKQYEELLERLRLSETRAEAGGKSLETALENIEKMRTAAQRFLINADKSNENNENEDNSYFTTYAHFGIHHEMLQDKVRTESYRTAILSNRPIFENKTVLDVGCGTAILSLFSAAAGAKLTIGVDQSEIIYQAMDIVRENGFESKIRLLKGRVESVELPVEKVDVIVSEWMGYFLYFEAMLDSVIFARDKYLAPDGRMVPNKCTISIGGINDLERHCSLVSFWDDVYGFKMTCMKTDVVREASVERVKSDAVVTSTAVINELDLMTCTSNAIEFSSTFDLTVEGSDKPVVGFVAYFDVHFELEEKVFFSTSPSSTPTHWKQCVFYLEEPLEKNIGDVISGRISCRRNLKDPRSLLITLEADGKTREYEIQ